MNKATNKILVVGATGNVGSVIVPLLISAGESVKAATRTPNKEMPASVEAVSFDYDDPNTFDNALSGVDRIFYLSRAADHLAAEVVKPLLDRAVAAGVKHIVNMSALGAEADESTALRQVEILIEKSGIPYTLLRPNFFMQNFSSGFMNDMIRDKSGLFLPAGDASVSFIDVRDIAEVAARALTTEGHKSKTYSLTGSAALTHERVVDALSKASSREIMYAPITDEDMEAALKASGLPAEPIDFILGLYRRMRSGHNTEVSGDVQQILGRAPRSFSDFASENSISF